MLKLKKPCEVVAVAPRIEFHGEDAEPAVTLRLRFLDVPLAVVQEAFCSQLSLFYGGGDESQFPELEPLQVSRSIENVTVEIANVILHRMRCNKVQLTPRAGRVVEVDLKLKGLLPDGGLDELHRAMCDANVPCELTEIEHRDEEQEEFPSASGF